MSSRYRSSAEPIGGAVAAALTAACRKRGFATATLALHWSDIVGAATAARAQPERLVWPRRRGGSDRPDPADRPERVAGGATLVVRADPMAAIVLQHEAPRILERVNQVFGWGAVERLKVTQLHRPMLQGAVRAPRPTANDADRARAQAVVGASGSTAAAASAATSDRLGAALVRLGANVHARLREAEGAPDSSTHR